MDIIEDFWMLLNEQSLIVAIIIISIITFVICIIFENICKSILNSDAMNPGHILGIIVSVVSSYVAYYLIQNKPQDSPLPLIPTLPDKTPEPTEIVPTAIPEKEALMTFEVVWKDGIYLRNNKSLSENDNDVPLPKEYIVHISQYDYQNPTLYWYDEEKTRLRAKKVRATYCKTEDNCVSGWISGTNKYIKKVN